MLGKRRQGVHREVLGRRRFVRLLLKTASGDVAEEEGFQRMRQLGEGGDACACPAMPTGVSLELPVRFLPGFRELPHLPATRLRRTSRLVGSSDYPRPPEPAEPAVASRGSTHGRPVSGSGSGCPERSSSRPVRTLPLVAGDEFGDGMLERAKASDVEAVLGEGETGLGGGQYQFQKTGKRPGIADRWHPSFRFSAFAWSASCKPSNGFAIDRTLAAR